MALNLELLEVEPGCFTVIVGSKFADHLCRDEALGVVAAALFGGHGPEMPYLKTYEQWTAWRLRHSRDGEFKPAAFLTWRGAAAH